MTKRDFKMISDTLAQRETFEAHFGTPSSRKAVEQTAEAFATRLDLEHPRFNRGIFLKAALPLAAAESAERVAAKVRA